LVLNKCDLALILLLFHSWWCDERHVISTHPLPPQKKCEEIGEDVRMYSLDVFQRLEENDRLKEIVSTKRVADVLLKNLDF